MTDLARFVATTCIAAGALIAEASEIRAQARARPEPDRQVVLVTGSTGGLGREVARRMAARGAHVIVHGRSRERGMALVEEIEREGVGSARFYAADLASLAQVRELAREILRDYERLDLLVNNAGIGSAPPERLLSEDGHEYRFQVNYLSHFLLTRLLLPRLIESAPSRIVNVSSLAQTPIDFDDVMLERDFGGGRAYAQSKLAQVMFTFDLHEELEGTGVMVNSLHPATYMPTGMVRRAGVEPRATLDEGADAVMQLITSTEIEGGQFFRGLRPGRAHAQAYDPGARAKLRGLSERLTGVGAGEQEASWPTLGWPASSPEAQGLDPNPLDALDRRIRAGDFGYLDRLLVVRGGYVVVNERYAHDYEEISRGRRSDIGCGFGCTEPGWDHQFNYLHPDWHPYHQGRDVHTLQSVTKSVAATLIAIAIRRGEIAGVDIPLLPLLGDRDLSAVDDRLREATLEDLLTMRLGIAWHETDRPMDGTNTSIQLERSDDWVAFTLAQPTDAAPGEKWVYSSGASHLMSAILIQATGRPMDRYAEEHLFEPLGIRDYHWKRAPEGLPDALGGLYLEAEQLAKIGYLYLMDGVWDGVRILPEGWVAAATARQVEDPGYGYQWWRPDPGGLEVWAAQGFGGQYLLVLPEHEIVAVINSWNLFGGDFPDVRDALVEALIARSERG